MIDALGKKRSGIGWCGRGLELHREGRHKKASEIEKQARRGCHLTMTNSISLDPMHMSYLRPPGYIYSYPAFLIKTISQGL